MFVIKKSWVILNWVMKLKKFVIVLVGFNFKCFLFDFCEIIIKVNENLKKK